MERRDFTSPVSYLPLVLLNPSLFFFFFPHPAPQPASHLAAIGLFSVPTSPVRFCLFILLDSASKRDHRVKSGVGARGGCSACGRWLSPGKRGRTVSVRAPAWDPVGCGPSGPQ